MNPHLPPSISSLSLRKDDHLFMAQASQTEAATKDSRFNYEPLFSAHPNKAKSFEFLGFNFSFPLWISSMTGGAQHAQKLNTLLARACEKFDLGMGLGSCRPLLESETTLKDFDVKSLMPHRPLFANLGIAQVETLLASGKTNRIVEMIKKLGATGLIIHVNPLQEWFQPEGDKFTVAPIETITKLLEVASYPVIVKEVGHGMGPASLKALMKLPLAAIEFGAYGGTNFSLLEANRSQDNTHLNLTKVGHTAEEMVGFIKEIISLETDLLCQKFIISGGIKDSLHGYYLVSQLPFGTALFGMANGVLKEALRGEEALNEFISNQEKQFAMAQSYVSPRVQRGDVV